MSLQSFVVSNLGTIGAILALMAVLALVEAAIPLHRRGPSHRAHVGPNLSLTSITFATNFFLNGALLLLLVWLDRIGFGLLRWTSLAPVAAGVVAVVALDFSYYLAHVAMHKVPALWRVHRVHHSDPVLDVTTTIRQHPVEGLYRYAVMAAAGTVLGVGLGAFTVYRIVSVLVGLLEHANVRVPRRLDAALALVTTFPNMHKVHHSRDQLETDSNYGNIFSWFDRLCGTYTPSQRGESVDCGLDGHDDAELQSTTGLLTLPLRSASGGAGRSSP